MRTDEDLKVIAKKVYNNETYLAIKPEDIQNSFMCIFVFLTDEISEQMKDAVAFYEDYSKASPRCLNGKPMFTSCGYLNKEETITVINYIKEIEELMKNFGGEKNEC